MLATWLADVLRAAGLTVSEVPGWKTRGRPGAFGPIKGVLAHHTGKGSVSGLLSLITNGRPDLQGPLSQLFLDKAGTYHVVAAGRSNHAGAGEWQGVTAGNTQFIGIEAQNAGDGKDPWPAEQMDAYVRGVAAILKHVGAGVIMAVGHKEYALPRGRKIDPNFDMTEFRKRVSATMQTGITPSAAGTPTEPKQDMLKRGDRGDSVEFLQLHLGLYQDGIFGPGTEAAVKKFQKANGLTDDGVVGPRTWKAIDEK